MKKHYQEWYKDATAIYIKFESSAMALKPQEHKAWKIAPVTSPSEVRIISLIMLNKEFLI